MKALIVSMTMLIFVLSSGMAVADHGKHQCSHSLHADKKWEKQHRKAERKYMKAMREYERALARDYRRELIRAAPSHHGYYPANDLQLVVRGDYFVAQVRLHQ